MTMKIRSVLCLGVVLFALAGAAAAKEPSLCVAADSSFGDALEEISSQFTGTTGCRVEVLRGESAALADQLLAGGRADVYFPSDAESIDRLREKGIVDVALARNIVVVERDGQDPAYLRAVVLAGAENRLQAMAFLDFLVSEPARGVFSAHGFALP
jgi:molybdate transport system substrate-binding protein